MDNLKNRHFTIANKLMLGLTALFVVFLTNIIVTLSLIETNTFLFIAYIQWSFLIIGLIIAGLSLFWWLLRGRKEATAYKELLATFDAIARSQAIIQFNMDGTIITANDKFLEAVGYTLEELQGKPHSMLVDSEYRASQEYRAFWDKLRRGEYDQAEYKRLKKNGQALWLQSSYNPIIDAKGKPIKIIKVATDITQRKTQEAKLASLTDSLHKVGLQIVEDSNNLSVGITQLEMTAGDQASSAVQQATSIAEISATIEEIKLTTQQTLAKAKKLGEAAERTSSEAENGKISIEKMTEAMHVLQNKIDEISTTIFGLNEKTQQIGEITDTVADIAKQSKLLALNASIEAAKAGETGKGFAVVAGEVKDLAEKSQLSTERVKKILQDIRQTSKQAVVVTKNGTKSVDETIQQVKLTGDVISALGILIEESASASLQIVSAIREESIAIGQIDLSMKEINKVTSLFTAAAEQTKQAVMNLNKVSDSLKNTATVYNE